MKLTKRKLFKIINNILKESPQPDKEPPMTRTYADDLETKKMMDPVSFFFHDVGKFFNTAGVLAGFYDNEEKISWMKKHASEDAYNLFRAMLGPATDEQTIRDILKKRGLNKYPPLLSGHEKDSKDLSFEKERLQSIVKLYEEYNHLLTIFLDKFVKEYSLYLSPWTLQEWGGDLPIWLIFEGMEKEANDLVEHLKRASHERTFINPIKQ